jgi:hypothetical protein
VGGLAAQTKDKWMVLIPRADHMMQAVRCHSMNKVTEDFPMYNVTKVVQEVKNDDPCNKILWNCRVPGIIGGEVDCLLGITYSLLHPEALHTFPTSGLSLYASSSGWWCPEPDTEFPSRSSKIQRWSDAKNSG